MVADGPGDRSGVGVTGQLGGDRRVLGVVTARCDVPGDGEPRTRGVGPVHVLQRDPEVPEVPLDVADDVEGGYRAAPLTGVRGGRRTGRYPGGGSRAHRSCRDGEQRPAIH